MDKKQVEKRFLNELSKKMAIKQVNVEILDEREVLKLTVVSDSFIGKKYILPNR